MTRRSTPGEALSGHQVYLPQFWRGSASANMSCRLRGRQLAASVALTLMLAGCVHDPIGVYRLQTEFESQPIAFRDEVRGEPLTISTKLQNLTAKEILIAGPNPGDQGLRLIARIDNAPPFLGSPSVEVGYRGGSYVLKASEATQTLWFDRQASAVDRLAQVGPVLLHINADDVHRNLSLLANEAAFNVIVPVNWSMVNRDHMVIRVEFNLAISVEFIGNNGKIFTFPGNFQRRIVAYLINGQRYPSGTLPAPNGPISGEFQAQAH
jgi:hypothetical protein